MSNYNINNKAIGGNITDKAILGFINNPLIKDLKIINKIPFNSKDKYSSSIVLNNGRKKLIKGAPEIIIKSCKYYYDEYGNKRILNIFEFNKKIEEFTKRGIRVIALAINDSDINNTFSELNLVGILFIKDEIREETVKGIELVNSAHIQTVMITGDNKETAI